MLTLPVQRRRFQDRPLHPPGDDPAGHHLADDLGDLARRLWRAHGLPAALRAPLPWETGAFVVARVLTACERDDAFAALPVPQQRAVRLAVRALAERDGITWPVRVSTRSARDRITAERTASMLTTASAGGVA